MRKLILFTFLLLLISTQVGCGGNANNTTAASTTPTTPTSPTTPPGAPPVSNSAPLSISMYTVLDTQQGAYSLDFAETGSTTCSTSTTSPSITCSVAVPEGRLYYSTLHFVFSWTTAKCAFLAFQPYFYRASNSATYNPPGLPGNTASIDCSGATSVPGAACYGGAAPQMVPKFPAEKGIIFLPNETVTQGPQSTDQALASASSLNVNSNRLTSNDLPSAKWGSTYTAAQLGGYLTSSGEQPAGDGYMPNTFVTYSLECVDQYYDPTGYAITINVTDVNSASGTASPVDNFNTWAEAP